MNNKTEPGGQAIAKLFAILEYMSKVRGSVRLQDISKHLEIPQSTMQRYLSSMVHLGYVYQDEESMRYMLTWKICRIGSKLSSPLSAKSIVSPYAIQLAQALNLATAVMVVQGYEGIYIDLIDDPSTLLISIARMGNCPPLNATASGKVLISQFTANELEDFIAIKGLEKCTVHTITDKEKLLEELERVRIQGYATEIEECSEGVECVAMPIYDFNDNIYMALSVFGKACITEPRVLHEQILPKLSQCAKEVSLRLGCSEKKLTSYKF